MNFFLKIFTQGEGIPKNPFFHLFPLPAIMSLDQLSIILILILGSCWDTFPELFFIETTVLRTRNFYFDLKMRTIKAEHCLLWQNKIVTLLNSSLLTINKNKIITIQVWHVHRVWPWWSLSGILAIPLERL